MYINDDYNHLLWILLSDDINFQVPVWSWGVSTKTVYGFLGGTSFPFSLSSSHI
jgi:hypothetical protein